MIDQYLTMLLKKATNANASMIYVPPSLQLVRIGSNNPEIDLVVCITEGFSFRYGRVKKYLLNFKTRLIGLTVLE